MAQEMKAFYALLGETNALMQPMHVEKGVQQPVFTRQGAFLSLQLASLAYDLQLDPWRQAGWRDVSYHVDNTLLTGEMANGGDGSGFGGLISEYRQRLARFKAHSTNLISQVLGTVRNREQSDTCKAVVMCRRHESGRYLVALGFMGTGKRMYDWIANFRFADEEGLHRGILQLTRHFEESLEEIEFPETAQELGLEKLTLNDILLECRRPASRFKLWLAGHSQGGAVMQVFAYRAVRQGVLRKNLIGYSFAAPSVLYGPGAADICGIPLFHILNQDDLVCRVGARLHIGRCLVYRAKEEMRAACYGNVWQKNEFRRMLALLQRVRDNQTAILMLIALLRALAALEDGETVQAVSALLGKFLPERLMGLVGGKMEDGLRFVRRYAERLYYRAVGHRRLPGGVIRCYEKYISGMMQEMGPRPFVKVLLQAMAIPHRMRQKASYGQVMPAYMYIVENALQELQPVITLRHPAARKEQREEARSRRSRAYGRFGRRI